MPQMKTIAIDCRFASTMSGLGRYTRELVTALLQRKSDVHYVLLVRSVAEEWIPTDADTIVANFPHYSLQEQLFLPAVIGRTKADLFFTPHFNVPFYCPIPYVVTIHDLILHRYPNHASGLKRFVYHALIKHAVKHAAQILTISNAMKEEILQEYPSSASRLHVIYEGVSEKYHPMPVDAVENIRKSYGLDRPFFLYIGNDKEHKNVQLLRDAFQSIGTTGRDIVYVTGHTEQERLLPSSSHEKRLQHMSDAELASLYTAAEAFVTATLYEGFCLPIAEALACGCPVIATNLPVIAEISGGRATLVEPTIEAFRNAMRQSYHHSDPYIVGTWDKTAEEAERVFHQLLNP